MPYLIDGHNLIPKVAGLSLSNPDDESQLVKLLQDFVRLRRQTVEVYFDNAPPGQAATRRMGTVLAHFVRQGQTADEAITHRLGKLGKAARNWVVVSSDHRVQAEARGVQAQVLSSEGFAQLLSATLAAQTSSPGAQEISLTSDEIEEWLHLFTRPKDNSSKTLS